jgi:hypothetical protein
MKRFLVIATLFASSGLFATPAITEKKPTFAPVTWVSSTPSDIITINNGIGGPIAIFIQVDARDMMGNPMEGINVKNCGTTSHVNAGSSAICYTTSANNPVSFSADGRSSDKFARGTYQVEQQ